MARVKAATLLLVLGVLGAGAGISAGSGRQECGADGGSPAEDQRTAVAIHPDSALEPKLKMSLLYPKVRSTDQVASYAITIENIGTATARNVETAAVVPIGGRLIDQPTRGVRPRYDPSSRILRWPSTQLEPGEKSKLTYPFQVRMGSPGVYQVQVQVCAEGLPLQTRVGQTKVQGIADLEMTIDQSRRVLDVNDTGTFTIRIKNIGSGDARRLALSGRHTDNIKVTETAGTEAQAAYSPKDPTAFVFPLIQRLGKGQSIELGIRVQALKAGTATFRVNLMHDGADDTLEELAQIRITPAR